MKFIFYFPDKQLTKEFTVLSAGLDAFFQHIVIPTAQQIVQDDLSTLYNIQCKIIIQKPNKNEFAQILIGYKEIPNQPDNHVHLGVFYNITSAYPHLAELLQHQRYERIALWKLTNVPKVENSLIADSESQDKILGTLAPEMYEIFKLPQSNSIPKIKSTLVSIPIAEFIKTTLNMVSTELVEEFKSSVDNALMELVLSQKTDQKMVALQRITLLKEETEEIPPTIATKFKDDILECDDLNKICKTLYHYLTKSGDYEILKENSYKNEIKKFNKHLIKEFAKNKFVNDFLKLDGPYSNKPTQDRITDIINKLEEYRSHKIISFSTEKITEQRLQYATHT